MWNTNHYTLDSDRFPLKDMPAYFFAHCPSSPQVVSEAATVRAGLGSMRNSVQSHWGPAATAHAQEGYQSPPPQDRHAVSGGVKGSSAVDPMDDDGDSSVRTLPWAYSWHLIRNEFLLYDGAKNRDSIPVLRARIPGSRPTDGNSQKRPNRGTVKFFYFITTFSASQQRKRLKILSSVQPARVTRAAVSS